MFMRVLDVNRAAGYERAINAYPVAAAVVDFLDRNPAGFNGTVGELFGKLQYEFGASENKPRTPRGMSGQLKRVAPALKGRGIDVTWMGHGNAGNRIAIRFVAQPPVPSSSSAPAPTRKP